MSDSDRGLDAWEASMQDVKRELAAERKMREEAEQERDAAVEMKAHHEVSASEAWAKLREAKATLRARVEHAERERDEALEKYAAAASENASGLVRYGEEKAARERAEAERDEWSRKYEQAEFDMLRMQVERDNAIAALKERKP